MIDANNGLYDYVCLVGCELFAYKVDEIKSCKFLVRNTSFISVW